MVAQTPSSSTNLYATNRGVSDPNDSRSVLRRMLSSFDAMVDVSSDGSPLSARCADTLLDDAVRSLAALGSARTGTPLSFDGAYSPTLTTPTSRDTAAVRASLASRLSLFGSPQVASARQCLQEVLKSDDTIVVNPVLAVRPYDPDKLVVVRSTHSTVDLEPLLDAEALHYATAFRDAILVPDDELDDAALADSLPYVDPALRDPANLLG